MTARADTADDTGLGLIELIVAIVVSGIVMAGIAAVLVNSWITQEQVISVSEATNRGQLVGSAVERAMRNALYFEVQAGGVAGGAGDTLLVRTSLTGDLRCQSFRLTEGSAPDFGTAFWSTDATSVSSPGPAWKTGIQRLGTSPYFQKTTDGTLTYSFQIDTDASPLNFTGDIAPRSDPADHIALGRDGCW